MTETMACIFGAVVIAFFFSVVAVLAILHGHRVRLSAGNERARVRLDTRAPHDRAADRAPKPVKKRGGRKGS